MDQCQKAFEALKDTLMKIPILVYPDPNKPCTLLTDASKYDCSAILTQEHAIVFDGKTSRHEHHITYVSGLFNDSQFNWAALTKEAYAIYMAVNKLSFCLTDANITLHGDHLPLKWLLQKTTLNVKVNDWGVELSD